MSEHDNRPEGYSPDPPDRLATVEAATAEHAEVLAAVAESVDVLTGMVARLTQSPDPFVGQAVSSDPASGQDTEPTVSNNQSQGWSAFASTDEAFQGRVADVMAWMEWANPTLLAAHNGDNQVPDCWPEHPGVVEELLALYGAWVAAYHGDPNDSMIAWHDRWVGPAMHRISNLYELKQCQTEHKPDVREQVNRTLRERREHQRT